MLKEMTSMNTPMIPQIPLSFFVLFVINRPG
jgi:hypothetical protein